MPVTAFHASMQFQIIDTNPATHDLGKPLRVTTLAYNYLSDPATVTYGGCIGTLPAAVTSASPTCTGRPISRSIGRVNG